LGSPDWKPTAPPSTSNVYLADEFVKMIASQAAFKANAVTVRTGDDDRTA